MSFHNISQMYSSCSLHTNYVPQMATQRVTALWFYDSVFFRTFYAVIIISAYMCNNGGAGKERSKYRNTIMYLFFQNVYLQLRKRKKWDFPHFPLGLPDFSGRKSGTS